MDRDDSNAATLNVLIEGYEDEHVSKALSDMQSREEDSSVLFDLIDADGSGTVWADEFCDAFHKAYTQDWP